MQTCPVREQIPQRTVGVRAGPELVFDRPLAEVLPQLADARPGAVNGRVGPELVFWSYILADGTDALFYACAEMEGVDCGKRAALICPAGSPQFLFRGNDAGTVRKLNCDAVAVAGVGDLRPACADTQFMNPLQLGLATCP